MSTPQPQVAHNGLVPVDGLVNCQRCGQDNLAWRKSLKTGFLVRLCRDVLGVSTTGNQLGDSLRCLEGRISPKKPQSDTPHFVSGTELLEVAEQATIGLELSKEA